MRLPDFTVAVAACDSAAVAILHVISSPECSIQQLQKLDAGLLNLQAPSLDIDRFLEWDRWTYLDAVCHRARLIQDDPLAKKFDISNALEISNEYFDRIAQSANPEVADRIRFEIQTMAQEIAQEFEVAVPDPSQLAEQPESEREVILLPAKYIKRPERLFIVDLLPTFLDGTANRESAFRRRVCSHRLLLLGIRSILFQAEHNAFPETIDDLERSELHIDPYSGNPFLMRSANDEIVIYSVGENGIDDGGPGESFYGRDPGMKLVRQRR